jgi:hypothetical protein
METTDAVPEDVLAYLDDLGASGDVNMYGAAPYVQEHFGVDLATALRYVSEWMRTFTERHPRLHK